MIDASVMEGWTPDQDLKPMQFRYVHQELMSRFKTLKVLEDVVQQEFGLDLATIASGDLSDQMVKLMMWAHDNEKMAALIEWLTEDVISKIEVLIEGSAKLRQESEALRATYAANGVLTEDFISMAKRLLAMYATVERMFVQGGETHRELFIELENLRGEHEALLRDAITNAHK